MRKLLKHIGTILKHKKYVCKICFKMGLIWQGFIHDLSKFSIAELKIAKYYDGKRSPHQVCREQLGFSPSWNHHYHRNKHHFQFWWDEDETGKIIPAKMPYKYVIENFCDMVGASQAYNPKGWKPEMLLNYWGTKCQDRLMEKTSFQLVDKLIRMFYNLGEDEFVKWYRANKKTLKKEYNKGNKDGTIV